MKVCIAEKPSVAKEIAHILGAKAKRNGFFEGNGYAVTWTYGHLCTLKEPHDYNKKWKRWNLSHLPIVPEKHSIKLKKNRGIPEQFKVIETLVSKATEVINCGDSGQEGELIQRWVLHLANCTVPIKRLWISSLTEEAIREGFKNLRDGNEFNSLYAAGSLRAIGDWMLGINATRFYTMKYGRGQYVLSVGRVQTPTLALVVKRQYEIEKFISKPFWELKTIYRDTTFSYTKGKFIKNEKVNEIFEKIKNKDLIIESFSIKKGKEHPPMLFDLTTLQVECNSKFGFSADQTLKIIQALYEKKLTTYPRVDTTYLSNDIYPKIKGIMLKLNNYKALITPLLKKPIKKTKKIFDDKKVTDHHAIIPTGITPSHLNQMELQVYDLICKKFIAAFYPECIVSNTTVKAKIETLEFKATGKQILEEGWRVVYPKKTANSNLKNNDLANKTNKETKEEKVMPTFEKNESGPQKPKIEEKKTTAPKHYSEATLLRAMETAGKNVDNAKLREALKENGIGRPSTRAAIIETLFKREYIKREKKRIIATPVGKALIRRISYDMLKSPELTGQWERKLRMVEKGEYNPQDYMEELKIMVNEACK